MLYLDSHASTPVDPRVLSTMLPWFSDHFANPSNRYCLGAQRAMVAVEEAREHLATLLSASPSELTFSSGATEALNLALRGLVKAYPERPKRIIVSSFEHSAILETVADLETQGYALSWLQPQSDGRIAPSTLEAALAEGPALAVVVMAAQNELGTLQPIAELAALTKGHGAFFICDAVQAVGRIPFSPGELGVDIAALSAHKFYGPKGVGALWVRSPRRKGPRLAPIFTGGGQEAGLRPGTLNVPGIVGLGEAARLAHLEMSSRTHHLDAMTSFFWQCLQRDLFLQGFGQDFAERTCGPAVPRLPGSLHLNLRGIETAHLLPSLSFCVSTGSACASSKEGGSHVLKAIGLPDNRRFGALRMGLLKDVTPEALSEASALLAAQVRQFAPQAR